MAGSRLTTMIFVGMLLGIAVGYACSITWPDPQTAKEIAGYIALVSDVFLRLIKMIIAPLVFSTLVVGIAHMGDAARGRAGRRQDAWAGSSRASLVLADARPGHGQSAAARRRTCPGRCRTRRRRPACTTPRSR